MDQFDCIFHKRHGIPVDNIITSRADIGVAAPPARLIRRPGANGVSDVMIFNSWRAVYMHAKVCAAGVYVVSPFFL